MGSPLGRGSAGGLIKRLAQLGTAPDDPPDARVRKAGLVRLSVLLVPLMTLWVLTYALLSLWGAAVVPFAYQVITLCSLAVFARTKRFAPFRDTQLFMFLLFPFLLQWILGGVQASSAVGIWAIGAPLGALVFLGPRRAWPWVGGFLVLLALSIVREFTAHVQADIPHSVQVSFLFLNISGPFITAFLMLHYFVGQRELALEALDHEHKLLQTERAKSERLLLNVLPEPIAARLKEREEVIADAFPDVTVLFADIVGFTPLTERVTPERTVEMLNELFSEFDLLAERHGLEKIKTIGDAYMVAGGLPKPTDDHASAAAEMALGMLEVATRLYAPDGEQVRVRIGMDSGPVIAGVIGRSKFIYDLWGDTVNTAARMESHGLPGRIQVTQRTRDRIRDRYTFEPRGFVQVKGKGQVSTYFLLGRLPD